MAKYRSAALPVRRKCEDNIARYAGLGPLIDGEKGGTHFDVDQTIAMSDGPFTSPLFFLTITTLAGPKTRITPLARVTFI